MEETEIVEEAATEETAEEVIEETEETESAEPETVEEIEEFEETIEEPEEAPEPEPSEPIELAMPVYTAEELLQKAHAAGDDPKVIEDPATGVSVFLCRHPCAFLMLHPSMVAARLTSSVPTD